MASVALGALLGVALLGFGLVEGHGGLLEPPMRSLAWRYGYDAPINYDWMSLYCGGFHKFQQAGGKCGLCGDPYNGPFENDRGGVYDTGIIVRHYPVGLREIEVKTEITAHHKGFISFKLCDNNEHTLTQQCLDRYPLRIREAQHLEDPYKFYPPENPKLHELHVELPQGVVCDRCVLQWTYTAGNSVGVGADGSRCLGCGLQETFVNCADISIGGTVDSIPVRKDAMPSGNGGEVVLPSVPDLTRIIDSASPDSFTDVLSAIGATGTGNGMLGNIRNGAQMPAGRPEVLRPALMSGAGGRPTGLGPVRRRPSGDRPGLTREDVTRARSGVSGAGNFRVHSGMQGGGHGNNRRPVHLSVGMDIFGNAVARVINQGARPQPRNPNLPTVQVVHVRQPGAGGQRQQAARGPGSNPSRVPPPSQVSGVVAAESQGGVVQTSQPGAFAEHSGTGSSMLDSVANVVGQLRQNRFNGQAQGISSRGNFHDSTGRFRQNGRATGAGSGLRQSRMQSVAGSQFSGQMEDPRRTFPSNAEWPRADGMLSHRDAVRRHPNLDTRDFSVAEIRNRVPDLPRNIGPRQDMSSAMERRDQHGMVPSRENWFPNSHQFVSDRRMRAHDHTMAKTEPRDRSSSLPRRIVVPSMTIAQHLLRKYPQLRGRVFLSRQAHVRNKYNSMTHRYARRQRWQ